MIPARLRILVVEDDPDEAISLCEILKGLGHTPVGPVHSGEEAVRTALDKASDLLLMDIRLPDQDGMLAALEILTRQNTPIVFITGYDDDDLLAAACHAGGLAYLLKPIGPRQLEVALKLAWAHFGDMTNLRAHAAGLEEALETRKQVEKAKGILMARLGLPEEEAYRRLQKQARDTNQKLSQVAASVIAAASTLWGEGAKPPSLPHG